MCAYRVIVADCQPFSCTPNTCTHINANIFSFVCILPSRRVHFVLFALRTSVNRRLSVLLSVHFIFLFLHISSVPFRSVQFIPVQSSVQCTVRAFVCAGIAISYRLCVAGAHNSLTGCTQMYTHFKCANKPLMEKSLCQKIIYEASRVPSSQLMQQHAHTHTHQQTKKYEKDIPTKKHDFTQRQEVGGGALARSQ